MNRFEKYFAGESPADHAFYLHQSFRHRPCGDARQGGLQREGLRRDGNQGRQRPPAIQKAMDTAAVKGGTVYLPPGEYTSGTIHLRSHVNLYLKPAPRSTRQKSPATLPRTSPSPKTLCCSAKSWRTFPLRARGTVDGQQKYFWEDDTLESAGWPHKMMQIKMGGSTRRSYPAGHPKQEDYPHLVWLGDSTNVRITGLSFLHSPSWSFALFNCSRVVVDGIYIYTSLTRSSLGRWHRHRQQPRHQHFQQHH